MFQSNVQQSCSNWSIPGKAFVLGEYAVLSGAPAIVAALPPRFGMVANSPNAPTVFHEKSPAANLVRWAKERGEGKFDGSFTRPEGSAGLGSSTAEFALAYAGLFGGRQEDWRRSWTLYRELSGGFASGADLVAQWTGGVSIFDPAGSCEKLANPLWGNLVVFSAAQQQGRKVATHDHLNWLQNRGWSTNASWMRDLRQAVERAVSSLSSNDPISFGKVLDEYANVLASLDLESPLTALDRAAFRHLPGVSGVKGSGAMQADVILVWMEPGSSHEQVIQVAHDRGLRLICDGLAMEPGITCEAI